MSGLSFTGKVVLVTGASSTVGCDLAKYFSKLGASLVLTDCDKYRLNKVSDECSGTSPVLKIAADLTKKEDVASVITETVTEFKKIDVLINLVGPPMNISNVEAPFDVLKCMLNFNVCSVYCLTQLAYPHLVKTKGNVVNVYDLLSESSSNVLSYNVSRSALDELTKSLASKFASEGVRVNSVCGGLVETPAENPEKPEKLPWPRTLGPEDIAAAVVFLASDLATFITGANLPVTGGKHLACVKETVKQTPKVHDKVSKGAAKRDESKSDPNHSKAGKKESSNVDSSTAESPKRNPQKEEPAKLSSAKNEGKKVDVDKPTTVKFHCSEKVLGKPDTPKNST